MGCGAGKEVLEAAPTTNLASKLVVFDEKYVVPPGAPLLLHMKAQFSWSGGDYRIKKVNPQNPKDKQVMFMVDHKVSFQEDKVIFDGEDEATRKPAFYMKEKLMQIADDQSIYSGKDKDKELFKVAGNLTNTELSTKVTDLSGAEHSIILAADFLAFKGSVWLGPAAGKGTCIARIESPVTYKTFLDAIGEDFILNISPGVDMCLIVAMVLSLQQMNQNQGG